ncbi:DedA family protein [Streptomyces phyllanthi]|uniref:DedA family protein n=1 Tax=Streptomyces phyllanthi TaxID=1803180 RepID=A0A5N8W3K9_9ACTN|nr:DedA family protein [Streptomyces phyllanthi]
MATDFLDWLHTVPQPTLVGATGAMVLLETTLGIGVFAPGEAGLLIASTTATTLPRFLVLWLVVTVCVMIGDSIGYTIGRRFGPRLGETRLIQRYGRRAWDRATDVLRRRGAWAVFFGRFIPGLRSLTPPAAGTAGLSFGKFLPATALGAACWSGLHIGLGVLLGQASRSYFFVLGGAVVVALAVTALVRRRKRSAPAGEDESVAAA